MARSVNFSLRTFLYPDCTKKLLSHNRSEVFLLYKLTEPGSPRFRIKIVRLKGKFASPSKIAE